MEREAQDSSGAVTRSRGLLCLRRTYVFYEGVLKAEGNVDTNVLSVLGEFGRDERLHGFTVSARVRNQDGTTRRVDLVDGFFASAKEAAFFTRRELRELRQREQLQQNG